MHKQRFVEFPGPILHKAVDPPPVAVEILVCHLDRKEKTVRFRGVTTHVDRLSQAAWKIDRELGKFNSTFCVDSVLAPWAIELADSILMHPDRRLVYWAGECVGTTDDFANWVGAIRRVMDEYDGPRPIYEFL